MIGSTAVANAKSYAWGDWMIGILRAFLTGGAVALTTIGGTSYVGLTGWKMWTVVGINFLSAGAYRLGEFLTLHGAPDQLQQTLQTAQEATAKAGEAIATAKTQADEQKKP
jgi:hypothetical protein